MLRRICRLLEIPIDGEKTVSKRVRQLLPWIITPVMAAIIVGSAVYVGTKNFFISKAKLNIENLLLSHRGLHLYIQRVMHPAFYNAIKEGSIASDYYSPELFSSSFMVRTYHGFTNEERLKMGLNELYYKLAADNPRNPVNKADEFESKLIRMFNERRDLKEYRGVVKLEGKNYLYLALPFLETNRSCLKCHGDPSQAPEGIQKMYTEEGGFGDKIGNIRAVEYIRAPIQDEMTAIYVTTAAATTAMLTLLFVLVFNKRLRKVVRSRTSNLEEEIAERKAVQTSLELFKSLLDHSTDAIYVIDPKSNRFLDVNETACSNLGYTRAELLSKTCVDICEHTMNESCWKNTAMQERGERHGVIRTRHKRRDGTFFPVEVTSNHIELQNGNYLLAVAHDLTEREKLEEQLRHAQKMEAIGTFTGGIAHDFNNIITAIVGYAALLQKNLAHDHAGRQFADGVLNSAERARNLTQSLLIFSRKQQSQPALIEMNSLVRETERLLKRIVPESIRIKTETAECDLPVFADRCQMEQVLMNLISNARDALPDGGDIVIVTERIDLKADEYSMHNMYGHTGNYFVLSVSDNGCGMDKETAERIFEPFFTTKEVGKGTGLGLSIVYGIVQEIHGHIVCSSEPGKGTMFKIFIPLSDATPGRMPDINENPCPG